MHRFCYHFAGAVELTSMFMKWRKQLKSIKQSGTAGDELAPLVIDPLITHVDAARQRGIAILGDIANLSLSLPVLPETGMPNYIDNGIERLGIGRSTSVTVQYPSVRQTFEWKPMLRNPYRVLIDILPSEPLLAGTVADISKKLATIELPGGGIARTRGAATVGQSVYIKGGGIQGTAPELPVVRLRFDAGARQRLGECINTHPDS